MQVAASGSVAAAGRQLHLTPVVLQPRKTTPHRKPGARH
jgi:hypothetical protein